jgi:hypothetical protein
VEYNFEWDPAKARENLRKHHVSFERAAQIFLDPHMLSIYDEAHSESEDRWVTLGMDQSDILLVVVHTFHEIEADTATIRLISARKVTRREAQAYHKR